MSERGRDPQPWDDDEVPTPTEWLILRGHTLTAPPPRPPLWTFAWACVYVLATTPFVRGFGRAMALGLMLAFCFSLLVLYFALASVGR